MPGAYWVHSARLRPVPTRLHTWFLSSVKARHRKPDHSRTVLLPLAEASVIPSGLNATLLTGPVLPISGKPSCVWVTRSHNRIVPSALPDASMRPSGLNATLLTTPMKVPAGAETSGLWVAAYHSGTAPKRSPAAAL